MHDGECRKCIDEDVVGADFENNIAKLHMIDTAYAFLSYTPLECSCRSQTFYLLYY